MVRLVATGRLPGPVDVRLVPALVLSMVSCLAVPVLPYGVALVVPWVALAAAVLASLTLVAAARRRRAVLTAVTAVAACALWIAAVVAVQAVGDRVPVKSSGWEDAVAAGQPLRLAGEATGRAVRSTGTFGESWHLSVAVDRFGHPVRAAPPGIEVVVSGDQDWQGVGVGTPLCFTAELESAGTTVFARARTGPDSGSCPPPGAVTDPGNGPGQGTAGDGSPGREVVRSAVREAASGSVGTAPQLLPGLVLGDRSVQEPELDEAMKTSGLSHLSAVSGANCTLLAGAVTMALRSVRTHRTVVLGAVLGVLVVFVVIVGPEPSVIRAAVMGALGAWAVFFGRGRHALPLLCLAACVLMGWTPSLAGEPAFQLSLAATAGIVLAARPVEQWLTAVLRRWLPGPVAGTIGAALAVTVTAQVACQPVLVGLSGTLSSYSVPANLLAAPLVPFVTVPGTAAAALAVPWPDLAAAVFWVVGWPAAGIGWIATVVSGWPGAVHPWPGGAPGVVLVVLHVAAAGALLWLLLRWERGRPARVRRLGTPVPRLAATDPRLRRSLALAWTVVCAAAGSQLGLVIAPPAGPVPDDWSLAACDVGQGDMLVLRTGEESAMVVDTGPDPAAASACLDRIGVERVDLLVLSHLHEDHAGATEAVVGCCAPAAVLYSTRDQVPDGSLPAGARQAVEGESGTAGGGPTSGGAEGGTPRPSSGPGTDRGVDWTVLASNPTAATENDASLQMLAAVHTPEGSYTVLLTGDMEEDASRALLRSGAYPARVDVLKVAHHGARNGGRDVVRAVDPALSVVQVGRENGYGHPHPAVVAELERHGPVIRTDLHGTTVVSLRDGQLVPAVVGGGAHGAAG